MKQLGKLSNIRKLSKTFVNYDSGGGIPDIKEALFTLSGAVIEDTGTFYMEDISDNSRNFLIETFITGIGYVSIPDWANRTVYGKGLPYKSASVISAPVNDTELIAADINNFYYDAVGTPNQIPVVSFYQNIDYENKGFNKHIGQVLDVITDVELSEAYVKDITLYATERTGDSLTACNSYFVVPDEDLTAIWVGTGETYSTIQLAASAATINQTIYVKTGNYSETNSQGGLYLTGVAKTIKCVGLCKMTPDGTGTVGIYIYSNSTIGIEGLIYTNTTKSLNVRMRLDGDHYLDRCYIDAQDTGIGLYSNDVGDSRTFKNSILLGYVNTQSNFLIDSCYLDRISTDFIIFLVTGSSLSLLNCYIPRDTGSGAIKITGDNTEVNIKGTILKGAIITATSIDNTYNISNNIISLINSLAPCNFDGGGHIINVLNNKFIDEAQELVDSCRIVRLNGTHGNAVIQGNSVESARSTQITVNNSTGTENIEICKNRLISTGDSALISSAYIDTIISDNILSSEGEAQIIHGAGDSNLVSLNVYNNIIYSNLYCSMSAGNLSGTGNNYSECNIYNNNIVNQGVITNNHCMFIQDVRNANVCNNRVVNQGLAIIMKGFGEDWTGVVNYNLIENCQKGITIKGASSVKCYGNTIKDSVNLGISVIVNDDTIDNWPSNNVILKNNIIDNAPYCLYYGVGTIGLISDNNVLVGDSVGNVDGVLKNWSEWQALGFDINGVNQDPQLDANLIPALTSPSIGAGEDLGNDYRLGLDSATNWGSDIQTPDVVTKYQENGAWDCGAFVNNNASYVIISENGTDENILIDDNNLIIIE